MSVDSVPVHAIVINWKFQLFSSAGSTCVSPWVIHLLQISPHISQNVMISCMRPESQEAMFLFIGRYSPYWYPRRRRFTTSGVRMSWCKGGNIPCAMCWPYNTAGPLPCLPPRPLGFQYVPFQACIHKSNVPAMPVRFAYPEVDWFYGTPVDDHLSYATTPPRWPNFPSPEWFPL
jgi:hypothetical protein